MAKDPDTRWSFDDASDAGLEDPRLVAAMREYLEVLEKDEAPNRQQFLERHPEIAWELSKCLDGLDIVHEAALSLKANRKTTGLFEAANPSIIPLGDFRIVREIGRGGMGIVYEAQQLSLGRRVAVKVLPFAASLDPARLERFIQEAKAAAHLHHTNIVPVFAVGVERGMHFYAMQLIDGESLSVSIRELRKLAGNPGANEIPTSSPKRANPATRDSEIPARPNRDPADLDATWPHAVAEADDPAARAADCDHPEARIETLAPGSTLLSDDHGNLPRYFRTVARLVRQAAEALEHAHSRGIVHRDIKPGNLLLDRRGDLWITDFGLAQFHDDGQLTRTGDLLGTLRYMSPEQASGGRAVLDHRTDVYSLGATMYEMLTLEPIFPGGDRASMLRQITDEDPRAPRSHDPRIPRELETIVLKATAKQPNDRYATAIQFAADLELWLQDKPIRARPPTIWERAAKWRRRHRGLVRSAVAFLCLAVIGLTTTAAVVLREHAKTTRAYERELKQRVAADANFREARQAIDGFTELVEEELANKPFMRQSRRKFLEASLRYYRTFLEQRHDDPSLQAELAASSERVSRIVDELATLDDLAPLLLLADSRIQTELKIPVERRIQIDENVAKLVADRTQSRSAPEKQGPSGSSTSVSTTSISPTSSLEEQHRFDELRTDRQKLLALLNGDQINRLKQLFWQQQGPFAFRAREVVTALRLTHDQRQQVNRIIEEERPPAPGMEPHKHSDLEDDHLFESLRKGDSSRQPIAHVETTNVDSDHSKKSQTKILFSGSPRSREAMDRTVARILQMFDSQQKATWKLLIGEPFSFSPAETSTPVSTVDMLPAGNQ